MKTLLLSIALLLSFNALSQEMTYRDGKIYYQGKTLSLKNAKKECIGISKEAFTCFNKAQRIRSINIGLSLYGGFWFLEGINTYSRGLERLGVRRLSIGLVCLSIPPARINKRKMWIAEGVNIYNASLTD